MKIRWRQQEIIFATVIFCCKILQFLSENFPVTDADLQSRGTLFLARNLAFNNLQHYLLPVLVPVLVVYIAFLFINAYMIPVLLYKKQQVLLFSACTLLIYIALAITLSASHYNKLMYLAAEYGPAVLRRQSLQHAISVTTIIFIFYGLYVFLRESCMEWMKKDSHKRSFRIMFLNTITNVGFIYIAVFAISTIFHFFSNDGAYIFYVFVLLPFIINCFINVYYTFPYRQRNNIPFSKFWYKLLIAPSILAVVSCLVFKIFGSPPVFILLLAIWIALVFIANPVSWLLFNFHRDKLETILTLEKDLGKKSADLQFLRSQINPHFLFNALNTLYGTALQENAGKTAGGVQKLGDMMRFMLHENHLDSIHMSREIEYLQNYIALQKLRTETSPDISISSNIQAAYCDHNIAPMLLIPFVENAFKHGISLVEKSWIKLDLSCNETSLWFDIYNSVHKRNHTDTEKDRSGIGLDNVKQRLNLLYPGKHELIIRQNEREYFVHLTLYFSKQKK